MDVSDQAALLTLARDALDAAARGNEAAIPRPDGGGAVLDEPRAAFVTLHTETGALRGCVGTTAATTALFETVDQMARAAALRDPRFVRVEPTEVPSLAIEISVLDPLERIHSIDDIEIGRHGVVVEGRGRRGLLLPQVASERGWTAKTFVAMTCEKAGLPADAYPADDLSLYRFSTTVFADPSGAPN